MMRADFSKFSFPLLAKDLIEQAQRKRTYVLRVLKATALYCCLIFLLFDYFFRSRWDISDRLGFGDDFLKMMFTVIAWGIYLILPAMTAGIIAGERERDTWELLLVTRLGKGTILLEKFLGALVGAWSFLLLSIPVMIIIYPLGGITAGRIMNAVWCLFLCILLVGATGTCCSAWCRTIAGALISTYLVIVGWIMIPLLIIMNLYPSWNDFTKTLLHQFYEFWFPGPRESTNIPWTLFWELQGPQTPGLLGTAGYLLYFSIPVFVQVLMLLGIAYLGVRRPIRTGGLSVWRRMFRLVDAFFLRINENPFTRGRKLFETREDLPEDYPIRWRERNRAFLSNPLQRLRIGLVISALLILTFVYSAWTMSVAGMFIVLIFLFTASILYFTVAGGSLVSRERSRQTLDVLLVAPIPVKAILSEKMAGLNRWYWWMMSAYGILVLFGGGLILSLDTGSALSSFRNTTDDWLIETLLLPIYLPPLAIWISVACGMIARSQSRAVTAAVTITAGWCLFGWGVAVSEGLTSLARLPGLTPLLLIGPLFGPLFLLTALVFREVQPFIALHQYLLLSTWNLVFFLTLSRVIRWWCFRNIAGKLERLECEHPKSGSAFTNMGALE